MKRKPKRGKNAVRRRIVRTGKPAVAPSSASEGAGAVAPADQPAAPVEDNRPRHVVLDNNVPGGFRMEPV